MLVELTIRDFAIIDQLTVRWAPGLNVLTGETGAGKSIIVDAVGVLLGDRVGAEVIRSGAERASIEALFELPAESIESGELQRWLRDQDLLPPEQDLSAQDLLILRREIGRNGRSVGRVNGQAVPVGTLQQIGDLLVDVHGQSQHLSLLRVREHLELLDRVAGLLEQRRAVAMLVGEWRAVQAERRRLLEEVRIAARERTLLEHEVAEIEAAALQPGEEEELVGLRQRLRNATRLRETVELGLLALHGTDEQRGAVDLLGEASVQLGLAGRLDLTLMPNGEELERLSAEVDEVGRVLRSYLDRLEADPRQLEDVESRLLTFADLKRKYGETVEAILDYLEQARSRLNTGERGEALLAEVAAREEQIVARLSEAAVSLSESRQAAAEPLADQVERELRELGMSGAKLRVAVHQQADPAGIPWPVEGGPERVAVDPTGADRVEFLFSANPGEPPRPLARIASGGELSRVALAMKAVLARADRRPTLIFDEVDTGVGGRLAPVVGQKLWSLTGTHQVLCVTHLPQVAAYADEHLVIAKRVEGESTRTAVQPLEADARVSELAAMLGDAHSVATAAAARELIAASSAWKRGQKTQRRSG